MAKGLKCYNCGKGIMIGHNVSHAKNRTRKIFKPNLHRARIVASGTPMRVRLCTKCLRLFKKKPAITEAQNKAETQSSEVSSIAPAMAGLA
ncbi:MAG: 50S ribosomal protein L28 [Candidatus Levybacteria bacterium]|nr:50S ribosomal protein L28 [Candidatus Levybacteria bacterium]